MNRLMLGFLCLALIGCADHAKVPRSFEAMKGKRITNVVYGECERYVNISLEDGTIVHFTGLPAGRVWMQAHEPKSE